MSEENKEIKEEIEETIEIENNVEHTEDAVKDDAWERSSEAAEGGATAEPSAKPRKPKKRISLSTFLVTSVALILAAVMVTYACCANLYKQKLADVQTTQAKYYPFEVFNAFLSAYSLEELDEDAMLEAALKAYVAATGDLYAAYYTAEEYELMSGTNAGDTEGIGINVINDEAVVDGVTYLGFRVINVSEGSPAKEAGVTVGDLIYAVGIGEGAQTVSELGYDVAIAQMQGAAGTDAQFCVLRDTAEGVERMEFTVRRAKVTTTSVYYRQSAQDPKVGIVKIVQFDLTTPPQFTTAVDTLKGLGCEKFVFDVRYNPGGDLRSIEAVLSYFLEKDDVIIRTVDTAGNQETSYVKAVTYKGDYASCSVSREDIGKYRGLQAVVLCNESTASAAELFAATFRDYGLGKLVGTTTFGKGSMQSIFSLKQYGLDGALKMTTAMYYPAKGDNYHGVGIAPHVSVTLSEEAAKKNVYLLTDEEDNQLQKALEQFGG